MEDEVKSREMRVRPLESSTRDVECQIYCIERSKCEQMVVSQKQFKLDSADEEMLLKGASSSPNWIRIENWIFHSGRKSLDLFPCPNKNCPPHLENVVPFGAENHDALVKVVVLHGRGGVEDGQGRVHLGLEGVVGASVVQIVAKTCDQKAKNLKQN